MTKIKKVNKIPPKIKKVIDKNDTESEDLEEKIEDTELENFKEFLQGFPDATTKRTVIPLDIESESPPPQVQTTTHVRRTTTTTPQSTIPQGKIYERNPYDVTIKNNPQNTNRRRDPLVTNPTFGRRDAIKNSELGNRQIDPDKREEYDTKNEKRKKYAWETR
jgi:hypothetical protein